MIYVYLYLYLYIHIHTYLYIYIYIDQPLHSLSPFIFSQSLRDLHAAVPEHIYIYMYLFM